MPPAQTDFNVGQISQTVTTTNIATPNSAHKVSTEVRNGQPTTFNATNIAPQTHPQYANQASFASVENQGYTNDEAKQKQNPKDTVPNVETQSTSSNSRHHILKSGPEPALDRQENGPGYGMVQTNEVTHRTAQYEAAPRHSVTTAERYQATEIQATTIPRLDGQPYVATSSSSRLATSAPYPLVATSATLATAEKYQATVPQVTTERGLNRNPGQHIEMLSSSCVPPAISHSLATSTTVAPQATAISTPINVGQQHIAVPFSAENAAATTTRVVATGPNKAPALHVTMQQNHITTCATVVSTVHPITNNDNIVTSSATNATTVPQYEAAAVATSQTSSSQSISATASSGIPPTPITTKAPTKPEISMTTLSTPDPTEVCTPKRMPNSDYAFQEDVYRQSPVPNVSSVFATAMTSLYGDPPVDLEPLAHTVFQAEPPVAPTTMCSPLPYSGSPVPHMMLHQFRASPARSPALSVGRLIILTL